MIHYKTEKEIETMSEGGKILAEVLFKILEKIKQGVTELEIDRLAEELIIKRGAFPAFKKVPGYNYTTCISTNDVVVHGIPAINSFKKGDIIGVDCGVYFKGLYTDMAETIRVKGQSNKDQSNKKDEVDKFLETGKKALKEAIKVAKVGNRIGNISKTIQEIVEKEGYSVVKSLIGHGVGRKLHEKPEVPGFLDKKIEKTPILKKGMTIAIEVIYNKGESEVVYGKDNWTIKTADGSVSGLFERTIAITKDDPLILT